MSGIEKHADEVIRSLERTQASLRGESISDAKRVMSEANLRYLKTFGLIEKDDPQTFGARLTLALNATRRALRLWWLLFSCGAPRKKPLGRGVSL